ncbi:MAG: hypothetical protein E6J90_18715 [Deltaproteobacteria bacterium]|nr:MAG: hypothetical protein E6J90_18715 [Deltaproteobacteria bacterium]
MLWTVAACGGGSLDPGAGNSGGTGSKTLSVDGSARASPRQINARAPADFDTDFSVRASLGTQAVTSGTVTVTSASGKTTLTVRGDNRWTGSAPGYDQVYVLDVVSGTDKLEGVRVDGPDIHVFTHPSEGETVDATMPLPIAWDRGEKADTAAMHAENIDSIAISDTGTYSLAPGALRTDKALARPNTLRLTRTNRVVPAGATADSTWTVSVDNTLDVVAQPQATPLVAR